MCVACGGQRGGKLFVIVELVTATGRNMIMASGRLELRPLTDQSMADEWTKE